MTRNLGVSEEVQQEIREVLEGKNYHIFFFKPYLKDNMTNYEGLGGLYVCGDTLKYGVEVFYTSFHLSEYQFNTLDSGEIAVVLSGERYENGKKRTISFRLKMRGLENIQVVFEKMNFRGIMDRL